MNISDRVTELTNRIFTIRRSYEQQAAAFEGSPTACLEFARTLGERARDETRLMREELEALKTPIVSMLVHEGRILIATGGGVFELKGDRLIWIRCQVPTPAAN
jgi:hypothetical protein